MIDIGTKDVSDKDNLNTTDLNIKDSDTDDLETLRHALDEEEKLAGEEREACGE